MSGLDIFAWIVLLMIIVAAVVIFIVLARLPGQIARRRGHPQADAISVAGWLGIFFFGVIWAVAMIWAFMVEPEVKTQTGFLRRGTR